MYNIFEKGWFFLRKIKNNLFLIFIISIIVVIFFSSCSNEEECYNCDDINNEWVIENYNLVKSFERSEILKYDAEIQREIFIVLKPERKKAIWLDKIKHLKTIVRSPEEVVFMNMVEEIVNINSFEDVWSDAQSMEYENMLAEAATKFNWSSNFIIYAFGTLGNLKSVGTNEWEIDSPLEKRNLSINPEIPKCNCKWGWCPGSDCGEKECEETDFGCGFLFLGSCVGICD